MMDYFSLEAEHFSALTEADARTAAAVAAKGCPFCGGRLHVANYKRKPRGGRLAAAGEEQPLRHSLCCGRRGCRRRVLPPSLRFLGRRVYVEAAVVLGSALAQASAKLCTAARISGVPARSLGRWLTWWREHVPRERWWMELRARLTPPGPQESRLPASLLEHLIAVVGKGPALARRVARCLAPATSWLPNALCFVGDALPGGDSS